MSISWMLNIITDMKLIVKPGTTCHSAQGLRLHNVHANLQYFAWTGIVGCVPKLEF